MNVFYPLAARLKTLVRHGLWFALLCIALSNSMAWAQTGTWAWHARESGGCATGPIIVVDQTSTDPDAIASQLCEAFACGAPWIYGGFYQYVNFGQGHIGYEGLCCLAGNSCDPAGLGVYGITISRVLVPKCNCKNDSPQTNVGNPINTATGGKSEAELDYQGSGPYPLRLTRYFNSPTFYVAPMAASFPVGNNWRLSYDRVLYYSGRTAQSAAAIPVPTVSISRAEGGGLTFTQNSDGVWVADADISDTLVPVTNACLGNGAGFALTVSPSDEVEVYSAAGRLCSITNRAGLTQTLNYNAQSQLTSVTDPFGRSLVFAYDSFGRVSTVTDPASNTITYQYDPALGNLVSVTYQDGKTRGYVYEDPNFGTFLTGIVDEDGQRYQTFAYDPATGDAISTQLGAGASLYTVQAVESHSSPTVKDPLGTTRTYTNTTVLGVRKNAGVSIPGPSISYQALTYDANGYVATQSDFNGNATTFQRQDPYGRLDLETQRVEASGSPQQRTINTTWAPNFHLRTQIVEPLRTTNMSYDSSGNMLSKSIVAGGGTRTWTYTYDAAGQVLTVIGPRTDVNQTTTYTFDSQENLSSVTNALGQTTRITSYDAHGRPLSMTDPNGLVTQMTYDARQRLLARNVGGEVTANTYDAAGQLNQVTRPDGSYITYFYDAAHRLTGIADSMGNSVAYTLDGMGNRTGENVYDSTSSLAQTKTRVFDAYSRLQKEIGAVNEITTYQYDNQGNLTVLTDPNGNSTAKAYDALNRLAQVTDQLSGQAKYAYDTLDQLIKVSDQRGLTTQYAIDGLGNVNQVQSPDTGTANSTYDTAGNILTKTDAQGQVTTYSYDALDRITGISYSTGPALNTTFSYDLGTNGIGHLMGIADNAGTIAYSYDIHGRVTAENRTVSGVSYVTGYAYDGEGRLAGVTYPSGRQIAYARDGDGRINSINTTMGGVTQTLLANASYRPFGPEQALTFGNSQTYTRSYDLDGRTASYTLPTQTMTLGYDPGSRITSITGSANSANPFNIGYDPLNRLTSFAGPGVAETFGYDAVGNRTQQTIAGMGSYTSTYSSASNRIASVTGPAAKTYTFDANGSVVNDTFKTLVYDARERMSQVTNSAGTTQYVVNSLGQRVQKIAGGATTVFHYDSGGRLIAETDGTGKVSVEYVYLNDVPLAVLK
jgi:YD repeat-containing protein